jgi:hypothetical protein
MTPLEKATDLTREYLDHTFRLHGILPREDVRLTALIATALAAERQAALEEAAKEAESWSPNGRWIAKCSRALASAGERREEKPTLCWNCDGGGCAMCGMGGHDAERCECPAHKRESK